MSEKDDGGLAFPYEERNGDGEPLVDHYGMSLRDYFAAKAMQGMVSTENWNGHIKNTAIDAYQIADEMIKERNK